LRDATAAGGAGKCKSPQGRYETLFLSNSKKSIFLDLSVKKIIFTDISYEKIKQTKIFSIAREKKS